MQFFKSDIEKSNIYLISTLIKRICIKNNSLEYAIRQLEELSKRPNLSGFKFFSEEDEDDKKFLAGKVQIMTMHKSKGDEFNLVFLPEFTEKNLPLTINSIALKSSEFIESVKNLNPNYKRKSDFELKQEILSENLRLLYVAITRAKIKTLVLYDKRFPSVFVDEFLHPEKVSEDSYVKHPNANKRWTRGADQLLLKLHSEGKSIKYIAAKMGRSQTSIAMRLGKLKQ